MADEKVVIKNVRVEFLSSKKDSYDNVISYFKLKEKNVEQKFAPIIKAEHKVPWFKTDKGHSILKVKTKYVKLKEPTKDETMTVDVAFSFYSMNDDCYGFYVSSLC